MRTGIGYDLHRLIPTLEKSSLPLGGVHIPCFFRIQAHSDGDVLLHALVDACLGALALGDIGQWFPDNRPENKSRPSSEFVRDVMKQVKAKGWHVENFDSTVLLEAPKLAPHTEEIRAHIAGLLEVDVSRVSVKAKTMEGLGPVGEGRAISCHAVVTLVPLSK